jgi:hypothetical protein
MVSNITRNSSINHHGPPANGKSGGIVGIAIGGVAGFLGVVFLSKYIYNKKCRNQNIKRGILPISYEV